MQLARVIRFNHGYCRSSQLLPILLPSRSTAPDARGQHWNIGPAHDRCRTVLDDSPTPTDLKVAVWAAVQRRAASYTEDRPSTSVQPEPIRTTAPSR